jgi:membrane protease subunit (stomatin/prohibitin family)
MPPLLIRAPMGQLDWPDTVKSGALVWKSPRGLRLKDTLVLREDEIAVFFSMGRCVWFLNQPYRYEMRKEFVQQLGPIVNFLISGAEADVYFLQKRPFEAKFGSRQPYQFRDRDFGMVSLRMFGQARYRISDPYAFISRFVGMEGLTTTPQIEERVKEQVLVASYDALGEFNKRGINVGDLAANLQEITSVAVAKAKPAFEPFGLELMALPQLYISMPEEVQKAVDAKAAMTVTGTSYTQYQAGQAVRDAVSSGRAIDASTQAVLQEAVRPADVHQTNIEVQGNYIASQQNTQIDIRDSVLNRSNIGPQGGPAPEAGSAAQGQPAGRSSPDSHEKYRRAVRRALRNDGTVDPTERGFLDEIREMEGIDSSTAAKLEGEVAMERAGPPAALVRCPKCGFESSAGHRFCGNCASPLA